MCEIAQKLVATASLLGHADCARSLLLLIESSVAVVRWHKGPVLASSGAIDVDAAGLLLRVEGLGQGSTVEPGAVLLALASICSIISSSTITSTSSIDAGVTVRCNDNGFYN